MYESRLPNLEIENAKLFYRNFAGRGSDYNDEGQRNFCVVIDDPEQAQQMAQDGWNVKISKHTDPDEKPTYYIPVAVDFRNTDRFPVKVYLYTRRSRKLLDESEVGQLDSAEFSNVDLLIKPSRWEKRDRNGVNRGIKAYLKEMHATLEESRFAEKYASYEYPEEDL